MRRVAVDSTSIASIGYNSQRRELEIEYRQSGNVYLYLDVTPDEHAALMAAESKGTYLNQIFKPQGNRFIIAKR